MSTTAHLVVPAADLKMLRETLCTAQHAIWRTAQKPNDAIARMDRLQVLVEEIDRHRPLGPGGKHGDLHTATCGCEDKRIVATSDDFDPPLSRRQAEQVQEVINESLRRDRASRGVTIEPGAIIVNSASLSEQVAKALDAIESRDYYEAKPHKAARDLEYVREILERAAGAS